MEFVDQQGRSYYYNRKSEETVWTKPAEERDYYPEQRKVTAAVREAQEDDASARARTTAVINKNPTQPYTVPALEINPVLPRQARRPPINDKYYTESTQLIEINQRSPASTPPASPAPPLPVRGCRWPGLLVTHQPYT